MFVGQTKSLKSDAPVLLNYVLCRVNCCQIFTSKYSSNLSPRQVSQSAVGRHLLPTRTGLLQRL